MIAIMKNSYYSTLEQKIQLINTSIGFDEAKQNDNRYYSTFNELVNQKSFFGVKLSIECEDLVPYSSHKYSDERDNTYSEDTTTSFIYNQFKDYAIGHGCSVKWNKPGDPLMVETEYLPFCETPDIDPIPRDKSRNAINDEMEGFVSPLFLENSKSQEFKWLSIFSNALNDDIHGAHVKSPCTNSILSQSEGKDECLDGG